LICTDIAKKFCKTEEQKEDVLHFHEDLESKIVELNDDFYVSVDIQGYATLPKDCDTNPL